MGNENIDYGAQLKDCINKHRELFKKRAIIDNRIYENMMEELANKSQKILDNIEHS